MKVGSINFLGNCYYFTLDCSRLRFNEQNLRGFSIHFLEPFLVRLLIGKSGFCDKNGMELNIMMVIKKEPKDSNEVNHRCLVYVYHNYYYLVREWAQRLKYLIVKGSPTCIEFENLMFFDLFIY